MRFELGKNMNKNKLYCTLCNILLENNQFNLKTTNSKYSNTFLITILENVTGKFLKQHFNICTQCYDLLNELDVIKLRQIEIQNQLKKYLDSPDSVTPLQGVNMVMSEIDNMKLLDSSDIIKNELPSLESDTYCDPHTDTKLINDTNEENYLDKPDSVTPLQCGNNMSEINNMKLLGNSDIIKNELPNLESDKFCDPYTNTKLINDKNEENTSTNRKKRRVKKISNKRKKYPEIPKPHTCHCLKAFRTAAELKNHMNSHDSYRPFSCEICGQSYKHKRAFNIHTDLHNGISPFTCIYCNKVFTQKGALMRHMPIHTGETPYQCDTCGKRFIHHTSFNVHRLSHTGLKSFKCNLCGLALISTSHLKRHMRVHSGEKKYVCSACGKRFSEKYNLGVHEKLHSNPCSSVSQKRKYSCQTCGVNFAKKVMLNEHSAKEHSTTTSNLEKVDNLKEVHYVASGSIPNMIPNG